MKYIIKIQRNKSFHLPLKIKENIKSKGLDRVVWILNYKDNSVQITFLKDVKTPHDKISEYIVKLYRNVYTYSLIKIPSIVYNYLDCQTFDYIVLNVNANVICIDTEKRLEISEISGLLRI